MIAGIAPATRKTGYRTDGILTSLGESASPMHAPHFAKGPPMCVVDTSISAAATKTQPGIAIHPGQPESLHLTEISRGEPGPGEVLIRVRQVGICGTDRELIRAHFGSAPPGEDALVLGHEMLGEVAAVGRGVPDVVPGELVTATVRRPDGCPACLAGQPDMCQWLDYTERGIAGQHGFMTETVVEDARWVVGVPRELAHIGILTEPLSVVEKALRQANLIQRRIASWNPKTALVIGAGPIGLLGTLLLRSHGLEVVTVARRPAPHTASEIVAASGARYVSVQETPLPEIAGDLPPIDLILEASGQSQPAFAAMELLGNNGVLVLLSGTGGNSEMTVPTDRINRGLLAGNKVVVGSVNSAREDFELAVADLGRFELLWPGLTSRLITRRLNGLGDYARILETPADDIKTVIEVG
jgi:threonine dehydrogenase-like Zn-dependent dehydrogenase